MAMLSPVCGLRPWRAPRVLVVKAPKPGMTTPLTARQCLGYRGEQGIDHALGLRLVQRSLGGDKRRQVGFLHGCFPQNRGVLDAHGTGWKLTGNAGVFTSCAGPVPAGASVIV